MALLRTIVGFIFVGLWTCIILPVAILSVFVTFSGDLSIWVGRRLWSPVLFRVAANAHLVTTGGDRVDFSKPAIFVCNHQGIMDVPALFMAVPIAFRFVVKKQLADIPVFGWYLRMAGHIIVDRANHTKAVKSLREGGEKIRRGTSVVVFPEGTRTRNGRILPFKKGPFLLALEAGVPIVPVAIEGSYKVFKKGGLVGSFGEEIRVRIGDPIDTAGLQQADSEALLRRVRNAIIDLNLAIGGVGSDREDAVAARGVEGIGKQRPSGKPDPHQQGETH